MRLWFRSRRRREQELAEELDFHMQQSAAREGSRRAAEARLGGSEAIKEECRQQWAWARLAEFGRDLRGGVRLLRRSPGFAAVAVVSLGLAIGANTAVFSALDALVLRPLPFPQASRVVRVVSTNPGGGLALDNPIWAGDYVAFRDDTGAFAALAGWTEDARNFALPGVAAHAEVKQVTAGFFEALGVRALRGRLLRPGLGVAGQEPEMVLSYGFWHSVLAGRAVVGRRATLDGIAYTVAGVLPPRWTVGSLGEFDADAYVRLTISPAQLAHDRRTALPLSIVGRLRPGVSAAQAAAAVAGTARRYAGAEKGWGETVVTLRRWRELEGNSGGIVTLLIGLTGLLLLIACASVGGLLLERGAARAPELATRRALGAGRARLLRQMWTESVVLAAAATALGMLAGAAGIRWIQANSTGLTLQLDRGVLALTATAAVATVVLVGLGPAWQASGGRPTRARLRRGLIAGEVALAMVMLAAGFTVVRQVQRDFHQRLGYQPQGVLAASLTLAGPAYATPAARALFLARLQAAAATLPGVAGATLVAPPRMNWDQPKVEPVGRQLPAAGPGEMPRVLAVSAGYFSVLEAPLLAGRAFTAADRAGAAPVAVVNQTAALRFYGGVRAALGQGVRIERKGEPAAREIVGVVGDIAQFSGDTRPAAFYEPLAQLPQRDIGIFMRAARPPAAGTLAPALRAAVARLDRALPLFDVQPLMAIAYGNVSGERALELLVTAFDLLALLLAAIGLYGIVAYAAERRRREVAIRMALGSDRGAATRLLLADGLRPALAGVAAGLGLAWLDSYALAHMFNVPARGWLLLGGPAALLAAVSLLASTLPAWRAARRPPMDVLKQL